MGRTRGNINDHLYPFERSQRETNPSGKGALFHCNNCNKDITNTVRVKCNTCPDFDLCVECFSVGAEVWPHKSYHPYRVIKKLSFPIISSDWSAEQEMLLLEGIEMFGPSNWADVAEHVGTKSEPECSEHYSTYYLSAPNFIPEMKEIIINLSSMAQGKGINFTSKGSDSSNVNDSAGSRRVKDYASEKSCKEDLDSSSTNLHGYNPKRHEFDIEYDNDAEKMLVDLEFNEDDTEIERELKLRVVRAYSCRIDERNRRKDFIIERGLLHPNPIENDFTPEEKDLCRRLDPFMRFHSKEEHDELVKIVVAEHRMLARIRELEAAKARLAKQRGSSEQEAAPSHTHSAAELLSEAEKQLCREMGYSAELYMKLQEVMATFIFKGRITKKSDTHAIFKKFEPSKLDRVYDMLVKKGISPPS